MSISWLAVYFGELVLIFCIPISLQVQYKTAPLCTVYLRTVALDTLYKGHAHLDCLTFTIPHRSGNACYTPPIYNSGGWQ